MFQLLTILFLSAAALPQNPGAPGAPRQLDCNTIATDMNPPSGAREFCQAQQALATARAEKDPDDQQRLLASAASALATAAGRLNEPALKAQALEMIVKLADTDLKDVAHAERLLREVIPYYPGNTLPLRKIVKLLETQERMDEAEATLLMARQQAPEDVDVLRDLAQFYSKLAAAKNKGGQ